MSKPHNIQTLVDQWVSQAEEDIEVARYLIAKPVDSPVRAICFHAQQAVEKYLKAYLTSRQIGFTRTHDIESLVRLIPNANELKLDRFSIYDLSEYAVESRYPGHEDEDPLQLQDARDATALAEEVRVAIRQTLRLP